MPYKSFKHMDVVRPATASPSSYEDSHMKAKSRTAEESERLDKILAHYEKDLEKQIIEQEKSAPQLVKKEDVVSI